MDWNELKDLDLAEIGQWPRPAKWLVWIGMTLFVSYMAFQLLIQEQLTALSRAEREERTLKLEFEERYRVVSRLAAQRGGASTVSPERGTAGNTEAMLLEQISRAGSSKGVEFLLFQPEPEQQTATYTEMPVRIQVAGSYHRFGHFLSELANLPATFSLHELRISGVGRKATAASSATERGDTQTMELVLKRYRLSSQNQAAVQGG